MDNIILIGSGGCMREVVWQIQDLNQIIPTWKIIGYVDIVVPEREKRILIGEESVPYLGNDNWLVQYDKEVNVAICIGDGKRRKKIAEKLCRNPRLHFPNIVMKDVELCRDAKFGMGCILCTNAKISTNVTIGNFAFINIDSLICHDGNIGNYVTLSPDVKLAGNVCIKDNCEIGMGAKVKQGVIIGKNSVVGAGAVVVKNVADNTTVVGVPARPLERG